MKTVLLITPSAVHRRLYEGLSRHFRTSVASTDIASEVTISAVVYDVLDSHTSFDLKLVYRFDCPFVILTPECRVRLTTDRPHRVLTYPVTADDLMAALWELGVDP